MLYCFRIFGTCIGLFAFTSCSSTSKKSNLLPLEGVYGKKVALVEINSGPTPSKIVRSALLSQLVSRGTFILLSDYAVNEAKKNLGELAEFKTIGAKVSADYILRIRRVQLGLKSKPQNSTEKQTLNDSGNAEVDLEFTHLDNNEVFSEIGSSNGQMQSNESISDFQFRLLKQAFGSFFDRYIILSQ